MANDHLCEPFYPAAEGDPGAKRILFFFSSQEDLEKQGTTVKDCSVDQLLNHEPSYHRKFFAFRVLCFSKVPGEFPYEQVLISRMNPYYFHFSLRAEIVSSFTYQ